MMQPSYFKSIPKFSEQFDALDVEKSGMIKVKNIKKIMMGTVADEEMQTLDDSLTLNYTEFLAALTSYNSFFNEECIEIAFN